MKNNDPKDSQENQTTEQEQIAKATKSAKDKQKQLDKLKAQELEAEKLKAKEFRSGKTEQQSENADLVADKGAATVAQQQQAGRSEEHLASTVDNADEIIAGQLNPQQVSVEQVSAENNSVGEEVVASVQGETEGESSAAEGSQQGHRIGKGGGANTPTGITFDITNGIKGGMITGGLVATTQSQIPGIPDPHSTNTPHSSISLTGTAQITPQVTPQLTPQVIPQQVPDKTVQHTPDPTLPPQVTPQVIPPGQVPDKIVQQTPDPTLPPQLTPGQVPDKVAQKTPDPTLSPQLTPGQVPDKIVQQTPNPTLPPQLTPGQVPDKIVQQTPDPILPPQLTPGQVPDKIVQQTPDPILPPQLTPGQVPDKIVQQTPDPILPPQLTPGQVPDKIVQYTPNPTLPPQLTPGQVPDKMVQQTPDPTLPPQLIPGQVPDKIVQQTPDPTLPPQLTPGQVPNQVPHAIPNAIPMVVPGKIPQPMHQAIPLSAAITIDAVTKDNIVNALEAKGNVAITGHVGGDVVDGDTITLTVNGKTFTGLVSGNTFDIAVTGSDLAVDNNVQAQVTVTNPDGRTLTATDGQTYTVDTLLNATDDVNTAIEDQGATATSGNVLNNDGQHGSQVTTTDVTSTYGTFHFKADGSYTYELDNAKVQYLTVNDHVTDTIPYSITDVAGNTATAKLTVTIAGTDDKAIITGNSTGDLTEDSEVTNTGTLHSSGSLHSSDVDNQDNSFVEGIISVDSGGQVTIGQLLVNKHGHWDYNIDNSKIQNLGDGDSLVERFTVKTVDGTPHEIIATVHGKTDVPPSIVVNVPNLAPIAIPHANPVVVPHQIPVAQVVHVPASASITIDDITSDNIINAAESKQQIQVTGTVFGDIKDGEIVTLTANGQQFTGAVKAGGYDILVSGADLAAENKIQAQVTGTSSTGDNFTATAELAYQVDTAAPLLSIRLDSITKDNIINANESGGDIDISGNVAGQFQAGDLITLTVNGKDFTGKAPANGHFTIAVPGSDLLADSNKEVSALLTSTDAAGNTGTATNTYQYGVDTTAPLLSIRLDSITKDNIINANESGGDIDISGNVAGQFQAGDLITLTVNGKDFTGHAPANGHFTIAVPGSDLLADSNKEVSALLTSTDAAGNTGTATNTYQYGVDTTAPLLSIRLDSITQDNIINANESGGDVNVIGNVAGQFQAGDLITLTVNGKGFTGHAPANGHFTIAVPGSDLLADSNKEVSALLTSTDTAGNTGTAINTYQYSVDTQASISMDVISKENILDIAEQQQNLAISGSVSGVEDGQTVTVSIDGQTFTADVQHGAWSTNLSPSQIQALSGGINNVIASVNDLAGNKAEMNSPLFIADAANQPLSMSFKTPPTPTGGGRVGSHISGDLVAPPLLQQLNPQGGTGGWAILDSHGHAVHSLHGDYGTLTIDPDTGHVEYIYNHAPSSGIKAAGGTHHAGQTISEEHHDIFQVMYHDSHASNVDVKVNVDVTYTQGHSGHNHMTTQLVDMHVSPADTQPAPPPPIPMEDQFDVAQIQAGEIESSPIDHYLAMLGIDKADAETNEQSSSNGDLLAPVTTSPTDDNGDPLIDDALVDAFFSPLYDDKHQHDLSTLDDSQDEQGLAEPLIDNDDDNLHQALNDMHSQI